jgi:hypothetical protein
MMYGMYSNTIERFLVVDDQLSFLYDTARILSSKMLFHIVQVRQPEIEIHNCIEYSIANPLQLKQRSPYPFYIDGKQDFEIQRGRQTIVPDEIFFEHLRFIRGVFCAVKACMITEYTRPGAYDDLIEDTPEDFVMIFGFKNRIFEILYESYSLDQAHNKLKLYFDTFGGDNPHAIAKKEKFFKLLEKYEQRFLPHSF